MDSYGLYEDWSLFNGDLLAVFPLLANEEPSPLIEEQDGLSTKTSVNEAPSVVLPKPSPKIVLGHPQQGSAELGLADLLASSPQKDLANPLGSAWMDTKMDLLNLLSSSASDISPTSSATVTQPMVQLQLIMSPSNMPAVALVPSVSVPSSPVGEEYLGGHLDVLQELLSADVKLDPVVKQDQQQQLQNIAYSADDSAMMDTEDLFQCLNETGLEDLLSSELDASIKDGPILSPVSADDIESLLSSNPPSPQNGLTSFIESLDNTQSDSAYDSLNNTAASENDDLTEAYNKMYKSLMDSSFQEPDHSEKSNIKSESYGNKSGGRKSARSGVEKKERKKEQNRTAALRYRQKKRGEQCTVEEECEGLQTRNTELKDKVDSISREIKYLKNLMAEVYKAKGLVLKTTKKNQNQNTIIKSF